MIMLMGTENIVFFSLKQVIENRGAMEEPPAKPVSSWILVQHSLLGLDLATYLIPEEKRFPEYVQVLPQSCDSMRDNMPQLGMKEQMIFEPDEVLSDMRIASMVLVISNLWIDILFGPEDKLLNQGFGFSQPG
ncbi:unnamed protein product [Orchesella dallaii]|uniref:Uncharacterized protein n=1 Tax=Orchesella dallaii TaxID=48710 RepID=A0ABP1PQ11_9HEXA